MGAVGAGPVPSPPSPFPYESLYPTRHRGAQGGASALGTVRTGGRANSSKGRRLRGLLPDRYKEAAANAEAAGALEAFDALYEKRFERTALAKKHWGCLSSPPHNPISIRARAHTHTHTHTCVFPTHPHTVRTRARARGSYNLKAIEDIARCAWEEDTQVSCPPPTPHAPPLSP